MFHPHLLDELRSAAPLVVPSLLAADLGNLEREIRSLEQAGARMLHLDIMDGHFVPNLSFGIPVVEAVRRITELPLDVHLMITQPERYLAAFRKAGADFLTVHIETIEKPNEILGKIRSMGAGVGISLNPPTPVSTLETCLDLCDLVLTMSVMPGFGGQQFQAVALEKLGWLRAHGASGLLLSVDGGVNADTIGPCAQAGADLLVAGTALLGHDDYRQRLEELTSIAKARAKARV